MEKCLLECGQVERDFHMLLLKSKQNDRVFSILCLSYTRREGYRCCVGPRVPLSQGS